MIVDTSALVAIVLEEPGHDALAAKLQAAEVSIGSPSVLELGIVLSSRRRRDERSLVTEILRNYDIETVVFSGEHSRVALDAFARYGRGRHRAALNFGDCLSYAVAKLANEPLLFLGDDFTHTDIEPA